MNPNILPNGTRFFVLLSGGVLIIACLYAAKAILLPSVVALLLSLILNPVVSVLQRIKLGRVFSALLATGCTFSFLVVLGWIFTQQLVELAGELPKHKATIVEKFAFFQAQSEVLLGRPMSFFQDVNKDIRKQIRPQHDADTKPEPLSVVVEQPYSPLAFTQMSVLVGPLLESLLEMVLVVVLVIVTLIQRENLRNRIIRLVGDNQLVCTTKILDDVVHRISNYLFMQAVVNFSFGALLWVGLFFIGAPYAFFFGLLAAFLRFVPYVGTSAVAAILIVCESAFFPGWTECWLTVGLFAVLELLAAYVAEPLLCGRKTGISPLALLVAAVFWSWLWGPVGLILSGPMTVCLVVLGKNVPNLTFLNILFGDEPVLTEQLRFSQRLLARDQDEAMEVVETYLRNHAVETVYDEILVPSLLMTKRDAARGEVTQEHKQWMYQIIRETLDDGVSQAENGEAAVAASAALVLGCAAHDDADELALQMLAGLLQARGLKLKLFSSHTLASELVAAVQQERPIAVVIASLPAGGLTHSHYLCKKLRARFPVLKIILARWGLTDRVEQTRERALAEGANDLQTRILETADALQSTPTALEWQEQKASA